MVKRIGGWLWMVGVVAAIIAVQALEQGRSLSRVDGILNGARVLVPAGIALAVLGAILVVAAMIHGLATDASHNQIALSLDDRVGSDTTVEPGKVAVSYRGRTVVANEGVFGYFRGRLLWGAELHEQSSMSELKRSWRSGEWLHVHRYLRETLVLVGLLLMVVGIFGTGALVSDLTIVRLLFLLAVAYVLGRTAYALARA